jgi:hypothetical protein
MRDKPQELQVIEVFLGFTHTIKPQTPVLFGLIDKQSRVNQSEFICTGCGNTVNADLNAAFNIALKGQERLKLLADKTPVTTWR